MLLASSLRWRESATWAFVLPSPDFHNWVSAAWSVDRSNWTSDAYIFGVSVPYHFLGQAMGGHLSRFSDLTAVTSVAIVVPTVIVISAFVALRTWLAETAGPTLSSIGASLILLFGLTPLEPISSLFPESFTQLASVGFLILGLAVVRRRALDPNSRLRIALALIGLLITASKVFTGFMFLGVIAVLALAFGLNRNFAKARLLGLDLAVCSVVVLASSYLFYTRASGGTVIRFSFGFGDLDYRWGIIGGPFPGKPIALLVMIASMAPIFYSLIRACLNPPDSKVSLERNVVDRGLAIAGAALIVLSFVVSFPPVGFAERYFLSTGIVLLLISGSSRSLEQVNSVLEKRCAVKFLTTAAIFCALVSLVTVAKLWAFVNWQWPSKRSALTWQLAPFGAVATSAVFMITRIRTQTSTGVKALVNTLLSLLVVLSLASGAAIAASYGARGSLKTLVGVVDGRVSLVDFVAELRGNPDRSLRYSSVLEDIEKGTPDGAVIASNFDLEVQLFIGSTTQRQLWWTPYLEAPRRNPRLTEHLQWRESVVEEFVAGASSSAILKMFSCGVTHLALDRTLLPLDPSEYSTSGLVDVGLQSETTLILEARNSVITAQENGLNNQEWCSRASPAGGSD